ncbi:MAG: response regulator [Clostridia bacterium]|nr:response regulator [Clostridia bacterium]
MDKDIKNENVSEYIENQDYIANKYTMKCFMVTMLVFTAIFILNQLGIFIIREKIMWEAFFPSLLIYFLAYIVAKIVPLSNKKMKYFLMFCITLVFTIAGVFLTYHVVLLSLFPFLYATLYSSKPMMRFVCFLTVISTIIIVYGGYYFGLCDANMVLLTVDVAKEYIVDGHFILNEVNDNPYLSLMLFFVLPRCLIYIAFMAVCSSIFSIVSGSLEKARLAGELEKAKTEAENANRAKSRFLAKMSHEIRTPINAVLGMNEMIIRESNEEAIREYAYDVKNSSELLLNIVNEILDSSKIESGMMEIVPVNYKMGSLLNDLYNMINIKIQDKKLKLVFDIDPSIPSEYYGDDSRIRQVLLNLLTNAVKYTDKGTVTMEVRCSADNENAVLHYSVKDTGIGISEENIGKIYDEFQRFDLSRNRSVEGTGLGMNIVQQLLKLMGSELHIKSEYGKGSEFYFDIEQKIVNAEPLGDFRKKFIQSAQKDNIRTEYFAPKAKVLVVDDNAINLKVFTRLIKKTRIQVYEAESGKECLELLRSQPVDMIFLDHMMPEMDGIETLHAIRDNKLCEGIPVIMLTANAIVGDREKYINEGFDDFLSKPIIPDELDKMILKHLPEELVITEGNIKK